MDLDSSPEANPSSDCSEAPGMPDELTPLTIPRLIADAAVRSPTSVALLAPGRVPLTYGRLHALIQSVVGDLNRLGIGRNDRVALVLDNGPELAAAFVMISAAATCAPLNPDYRDSEFDFYLHDLNARALVLLKGSQSPARRAALARGVAVLELVPQADQEAGMFTLSGSPGSSPPDPGFAQAGDVALVLHTSGTTSRPKRVPLTHANVCTSAHTIRTTLQLTPDDCCLNVMPLFHIHGLIGATLSSLAAGASLICTPGYDAARSFSWLEEFGPTWYTAVPTVHQAILAAAEQYPGPVPRGRLRLIRSSSSALPPQVLHDLERTFQVPVLESYGMTEAAHQMCSNPLPPAVRKPGSVGLPAGPEVAIRDEKGRLGGPNTIGEIVIRGTSVTAGYESNPSANQEAFVDGWFRTGDLGYRDSDGYYFLTGRLKELINRGGEKIAPREVDDVLLAHPAVAQAVTFAVPHPRLGEDVVAAVVLRPDNRVSEADVRRFALDRLAGHKVPSQVIFLNQLPKGPTGKPQRIGLYEKLAPLLRAPFVAPVGPVEEAVANAWRDVLQVDRIGAQDNFFFLGGDSLLAMRVVARLGSAFEIELPLETMFRAPTVVGQALVIEDLVLAIVERLPESL
jgi:acyl-CoA synthetase (AMP-forming)/AMP-acid ligase II/acyl carrier protein